MDAMRENAGVHARRFVTKRQRVPRCPRKNLRGTSFRERDGWEVRGMPAKKKAAPAKKPAAKKVAAKKPAAKKAAAKKK